MSWEIPFEHAHLWGTWSGNVDTQEEFGVKIGLHLSHCIISSSFPVCVILNVMNLRAETALVVPSTFVVMEQISHECLLGWVRLSPTVIQIPLQGHYYGCRGRLWVSGRHLKKEARSHGGWWPHTRALRLNENENDKITYCINKINCMRSLLGCEKWGT